MHRSLGRFRFEPRPFYRPQVAPRRRVSGAQGKRSDDGKTHGHAGVRSDGRQVRQPGRPSVKRSGKWKETTWSQYRDEVRTAAKALIHLGIEPGKGVSIIGFNSPQWQVADLAAIYVGARPAGIYTTNSPDQCKYVASHSESQIAVVENPEQLAKFLEIRDALDLKAIVMMYGDSGEDGVYAWPEFLKLGEEVSDEELEKRIKAQKTDDVCTYIYTSGTTGDPKAVMISHDNITWTAKADPRGPRRAGWRSHAERTCRCRTSPSRSSRCTDRWSRVRRCRLPRASKSSATTCARSDPPIFSGRAAGVGKDPSEDRSGRLAKYRAQEEDRRRGPARQGLEGRLRRPAGASRTSHAVRDSPTSWCSARFVNTSGSIECRIADHLGRTDQQGHPRVLLEPRSLPIMEVYGMSGVHRARDDLAACRVQIPHGLRWVAMLAGGRAQDRGRRRNLHEAAATCSRATSKTRRSHRRDASTKRAGFTRGDIGETRQAKASFKHHRP